MDPDATYTISNISLEFDTIINASLASQIRTEYMKSSILYDRILRAHIIPLNKSDTSFSVDINSPSKSLNATDKANNAKDQTVASIYDNRFCIPLDFEILETSLPLYQYGLGSHLTYELTFADYSDVIKSMDHDATYTISNISLEFDTIINASLASQIRTENMKSSILYDRILRAHIIPLNKSDTSFSVDINSPSKSLKGVLLIFTQERSATKFA